MSKKLILASLLLTTVSLAAGQSSKPGKKQNLPEGGTNASYVLLSGGAVLGAMFLARRRRTLSNRG